MVGIEFNLISCEFGGRLMVGFVSIGVREHLLSIEYIMHWIDEKLIVIYVCMCMFDGVGGQDLEGDRGKQLETSNK